MKSNGTWEVIVYDGMHWFRGPVKFATVDEASEAAMRITLAPTMVKSTREIETSGLPKVAPDLSRFR
jgi:hypothetical protein